MPVNLIPPSGPHYSSRALLEGRFGVANVKDISDVNSTGATDDAQIDSILGFVDAEIDSALGQAFNTPLATSLGATPPAIEDVATDLAWAMLWTVRKGQESEDGQGLVKDSYAALRQKAYLKMANWLNRPSMLNAVLRTDLDLSPIAI